MFASSQSRSRAEQLLPRMSRCPGLTSVSSLPSKSSWCQAQSILKELRQTISTVSSLRCALMTRYRRFRDMLALTEVRTRSMVFCRPIPKSLPTPTMLASTECWSRMSNFSRLLSRETWFQAILLDGTGSIHSTSMITITFILIAGMLANSYQDATLFSLGLASGLLTTRRTPSTFCSGILVLRVKNSSLSSTKSNS